MKPTTVLLSVFLLASTQMSAGDTLNSRHLTEAKLERIERDLIRAFESDVPGLQASAAVTLHELREIAPHYDWSRSVVPLMHILNRDEHDASARVAAALVLHELRSSRGDWVIQRTAQLESNPRVKRYCMILLKSRMLECSELSRH
jgi:hypothetical protein